MSKKLKIALPLLFAAVLAGCHNPNSGTPVGSTPGTTNPGGGNGGGTGGNTNVGVAPLQADSSFEITVTNNTAAQPYSPVAIITSSRVNEVFQLGAAASVTLEQLAEGGNNSPLINAKASLPEVGVARSGVGVIDPGSSETITFSVVKAAAKYLTVASMLVNTNDGFIAEQIDLSSIAVGQTLKLNAPVWDAGTEGNSEAAGTIPGPADPSSNTNKGFLPARNDLVDAITTHRGVISSKDGLSTSILTAQHRFLNPAAKIMIKRIK